MIRIRGKRAFTLIEIMIAVAIIAVLAGIAVPSYRKAKETAQRRSCYANLRTIGAALEWYCADHNQDYVIATDEDFEPLVKEGYLNAVPVCPTKGPGQYTAGGGSKAPRCNYHGTVNPE